ncbi:alpha/beta hydrolase family protein [Rhodopirellula sp. P2]|uniref:alpha/beta hydrolase family protein n=1 Tax=Rhodopirellula sp. P2 TaxID=2127060 RepID=UPI0023676323|nr:alpha/beta hydrolase family protein [Rhodopirellula sp. P2]WDQ16327.1 alpha/beta hydrolase family protein [Rhodopirellula sp. P2]
MINTLLFLLTFNVVGPPVVEDLNVLDGGNPNAPSWIDWNDPGLMLAHHLNGLTRECLAAREDEVSALKTAEDWKARQTKVRQTLDQILGPWPDRTPLNPQVTGTLQKDGYRVEKIVFESMPHFYVTGALFIPDGLEEPRPAILKVIGHSAQAFRRDLYQNVILNLVHKGFVVFTIDPLGQGERLQSFDPQTGKSTVGSSTKEHSHAGVQCFLTGRSIARYFTWDGIRAIDYLLTRPEVDPNRIGVTGLSGGGTQSSYIGAVDQRVHAVAPTGYITSISRLLGSIGPQDAEQVFYHGPLLGIDHADLLEVRAPKPTLQVTTTRDFFSIQGARETAAEVRHAFRILGHPERFDQVEDDFGHGFTKQNNESTYEFFQTFLELPGNPEEQTYPFLTEAELTVTQTGQVSTALESENVFSINRREAQPMLERLIESRRDFFQHLPQALSEAARLSGYRKPDATVAPVFRGQYQREGYRVQKWGVPGEGETIIPTLVFAPDEPGAWPAIIYVRGDGKTTDAAAGGKIEELVRRGYVVAAPDLLGYGETAYKFRQGHASVQPFFNALMSGRSVAGINAGDVVRVMEFLQDRDDVKPDQIGAIAIGDVGPALLHAAAFEQQIQWLVLVDSLLDYQSIVDHELYDVNANSLVAGALTSYDLPDLLASITPRRVAVAQPRTHLRTAATNDEITSSLGFVQQHAKDRLRVETEAADLLKLVEWCVAR